MRTIIYWNSFKIGQYKDIWNNFLICTKKADFRRLLTLYP